MKKKMIMIAFVAAFALTASVAFAHKKVQQPHFPYNSNQCCVNQDPCCPDVDINTYNGAMVQNSVVAVSNTGGAAVIGHDYFPMMSTSSITTGNAQAVNDVQTSAVTKVTVDRPATGDLSVNTTSNPVVINKAGAIANSGVVISKTGTIKTGSAISQNSVLSVGDVTVNVK